MKHFAFVLLWLIPFTGCQVSEKSARQQSDSIKQPGTAKRYSQATLKVDYGISTVGISNYTLITDDVEAHRKDADAIMRVKKDWPLAMQTKDEALFNRILARDFTFRGEDEFFERVNYIRDRVDSPVAVETAIYENLALQFFDEVAVLTYRNIVKGKDDRGEAETWLYNWSDIFVKEDGEWKIGASHLIGGRKL
jgi:ketosteroid isomerase-like protein